MALHFLPPSFPVTADLPPPTTTNPCLTRREIAYYFYASVVSILDDPWVVVALTSRADSLFASLGCPSPPIENHWMPQSPPMRVDLTDNLEDNNDDGGVDDESDAYEVDTQRFVVETCDASLDTRSNRSGPQPEPA
eukprot:scaffold8828_cov204-Amphora_coffeaeformis.AAC.8